MDSHFVVSTKKSTFTCHLTGDGWEVTIYQHQRLNSGGVEGKITMPKDWAPTRVIQYLEILDKA